MKKQYFLWGLALFFSLLLTGCKNDTALQEQLRNSLSDQVQSVTITHLSGGDETSFSMEGADLEPLKDWITSLSLLKEKTFALGEAPGEKEEGGELFYFDLGENGPAFSYRDFGDCYIVVDNKWYPVKNPSAPPVLKSENAEFPVPITCTENKLGITLTASNITPTGLTLICTQSGGLITGELMTGDFFIVEKEENGNWKEVEPIKERMFDDIAYTIQKDNITSWDIDWTYAYGSLSSGQYRIKKEIMDFRETADYDTYTYYGEFTIPAEIGS